MIERLWSLVRPFRGTDVRRMVGWISLAVALPRLPGWPGPSIVYPLQLLPQATFGLMLLAVGIGLLATGNRWRLHWTGRLLAVLGFSAWVTLAAATTSVTSLLIDAVIAWALLGEIVTQRGNDV
jgi:hypothetical protein